MYAFFFLLHDELHLWDFILDSISWLEREATSTATSSIYFATRQYPLRSCPGDSTIIEWSEVSGRERYFYTILFDHMIESFYELFFDDDFVPCTASICDDTRDVLYSFFFPGCECFRIEMYHKKNLRDIHTIRICIFVNYYSYSSGFWYVQTPEGFFSTLQPFCSCILGIDWRSPFCISSSPVRISGYFSDIILIYPR
jgi:hypothetical protein